MSRVVIITLLEFVLVSPTEAQILPGWTQVDCAQSMVAFDDSFNCAERRGEDIGRAYAMGYLTSGNLHRVGIWLGVDYVIGDSWLQAYTNERAHEVLRRLSGVSGTTELMQSGTTSYITYESRSARCIAFDQPSPYYLYGYQWILRGVACVAPDQDASFQLARAVLAATRVGPASAGRNALSGPVVPFEPPVR